MRGDRQVANVDYFETYAPVVSLTTVRLLLVLSVAFDLTTRQVDYANAFAQADLNKEVYVELPRGFDPPDTDSTSGYVLKLRKSLYGLKQAPLKFFELLKSKLEARGFRQSEHDPCLFIRPDMVCVCYIDDCLICGRDSKKVDEMIASIDMELTVEGDIETFLGIHFDRDSANGRIKLTQEGLINKVLKTTGLENCNADRTPATTEPLGSDKNGEPYDEKWSYPSVVGMLLYLASNSKPDIAFAVHQAARFTHDPKKSHAKAVKRICRYLKGTIEDGIILKPTEEWTVDCHVDADFAGLWGVEDDQDPICVKSRTGYVLSVAGCPVTWVSKLQSEITVSTLESEYVALSFACRDLIPLRRLVAELSVPLHKGENLQCRAYSNIWEDNNGCISLVNLNRMTPRTKHIGIKYHFAREYVKNGEVKVLKIDTKEQLADIMTKGLAPEPFVAIRKLLCGW